MPNRDEEWRAVPGWPGYEASSEGRVRSVDRVLPVSGQGYRKLRGKLLKLQTSFINNKEYRTVGVYRSSRRHTVRVHHLVCFAFLGPRPQGKVTRHRDDDGTNNTIENLCYGTTAENCRDAVLNGTNSSTAKTHCPRGHVLKEPNLRPRRDKRRECLACGRGSTFIRAHPGPSLQDMSDIYFEGINS